MGIIIVHLGLTLFGHMKKFHQKAIDFRSVIFGAREHMEDRRGGFFLEMLDMQHTRHLGQIIRI